MFQASSIIKLHFSSAYVYSTEPLASILNEQQQQQQTLFHHLEVTVD